MAAQNTLEADQSGRIDLKRYSTVFLQKWLDAHARERSPYAWAVIKYLELLSIKGNTLDFAYLVGDELRLKYVGHSPGPYLRRPTLNSEEN